MIQIKNLYKSFGKVDVLHNINLSFIPGEINGIAGRNGAGKTTLFRCIASLEEFIGQVIIEPRKLKYQIGFLAADPYFMTRITGREYLQLLSNANGSKSGSFDSKNVFDLPLDQYANTYSTGMKKKLAITGILIQNNEILILDEPFNGVDIQSNVLITEIIKRLKSAGKTIILSSHILGSLSELCDQIHILDNGVVSKSVSRMMFGSLNQEMIDLDFEEKMIKLGLDGIEQ